VPRVVGGNEGHGLDGADGRARAAAGAGGPVDDGQEIRRVDGVQQSKAPLGDHGLATAAAAVADEADSFPDVFPELDQVAVPGLVEQCQSLGDVDLRA